MFAAAPINLVDSSVIGLSADGQSETPSISADGQLVAFSSTAPNLVHHDFNNVRDVFLYNRGTGEVSLLSENSEGTASAVNGAHSPAISGDGRYVLFRSQSNNLIAGVSGNQLYVRDLQLGQTHLVSARDGTTDTEGNDDCGLAAITPDGRYVVFESESSNLVDGDANNQTDIFVRDLIDHTTELVSLANDGQANSFDSFNPSITPDGRFVVFGTSGALVGIDGNGIEDIYVRDRQNDTTELVTADPTNSFSANQHAGTMSRQPISDDGRFVVFWNAATNLVTENTNNQTNAFVRDLVENTTYLLSRNRTAGFGSNGNLPVITPDGRYAAWTGIGSQIASDVIDTNGQFNVFRSDLSNLANITSQMVSVNAAGTSGGNETSGLAYVEISPDGRYVAFVSRADNLVSAPSDGNDHFADGNRRRDVFVRDMQQAATQLVSLNAAGDAGASDGSYTPVINDPAQAEGRVVVAFESFAADIATGDRNLNQDIFIRDMSGDDPAADDRSELASVRSSLLPDERVGWGGGELQSASDDGRYVAFLSDAWNGAGFSDLTPEVATLFGWVNAYVRDTWTGETTVESVSPDGARADGTVGAARLSRDGRQIAFTSSRAIDGQFPGVAGNHVYVRDREAGVTRMITLQPDGQPSAGSEWPATFDFSRNGRYVAWTSSASDLVEGFVDGNGTAFNFGQHDIFLRDLHTGVTRLVSHIPGSPTSSGNGFSWQPVFSPDGRKLAFLSAATNLADSVSDANGRTDLFVYDIASGEVTAASVVPGGAATGNHQSGTGVASDYAFSGDGKYLFFGSQASNLVDNDLNGGFLDVFRRDLEDNATELVSMNQALTGSGNNSSFGLSVNADGRYVAFISNANNLVAGDTGGLADAFVRDMVLGVTERVSVDVDGGSANNASSTVKISPNGRRVAFTSLASDLVAPFVDGNGGGHDAYVRDLDAQTTVLVTANISGMASGDTNILSGTPYAIFSASGDTLYFEGTSSNLWAGDLNRKTDVLAYRVQGTGRIAGTLFEDEDGSGAQDGAEAGIQYWTVYLDANRNGRLDAGETMAQTDAAGAFAFNGLAAGEYSVALKLADGFKQTAPLDPIRPTVTLATNETQVGGVDIGVQDAVIDLDVSGVAGPATGAVGGLIDVSWTVRNLGTDDASASWQDAVYLSANATLDDGDALVAVVSREGGLAAGASYTQSMSVSAGLLPAGQYFVFVRTDRRGQVTDDNNRGNNLARSFDPVSLSIPSLTLGEAWADRFTAVNQVRYYQVVVPAGEPLTVDLDSVAADGGTEVYVRYGALPTAWEYDLASRGSSPDQRLVVPLTQPGVYYVMARSRFGAAASSDFLLTASLPAFGIESIDLPSAGNAGRITLALRGLRFTDDTRAELVMGATTLSAIAIDFRDGSLIYATFDLAGQSIGTYDVRVIEGASTATLPAAFEVVPGVVNPVQVTLTTPRNIRAGRNGVAIVEYVNTSNNDVVAPLMRLSADRAVLRLEDDREFGGGSIDFLGIGASGPAGVLRPGERGEIRIPFLHTGPANVDINLQVETLDSASALMDWSGIKTAFRPGHIGAEAWDAVFDNFLLEAGLTTGDYQAMLARSASYLSGIGVSTGNVTRLLTYELAKADAVFTASSLASVVDASFPTPGADLTFVRLHQQSIHGRYATGPFGRGWTHNWDIQATTLDSGDVVLRFGGSRRFFAQQTDGSYRGGFGDHATLASIGGAYVLTETDSTVIAFRADGRFDYIEEDNANRVTAGYDNGRLSSLTHSSGPAIAIGYNDQGRIDLVTDPAGRTVSYSYDASGEHLIGYTDKYGSHTYTYLSGQGAAREHALESINFSDDTHVEFQYDSRGRLIRENRDGDSVPVVYGYLPGGGYTVTDAAGGTSTLLHDDIGQVRRTVDPLGRVANYSYDRDYNLIAAEFPQGVRNEYEYDARGNVVRMEDALGQSVHFAYDDRDNLLSFTDARGNTTGYRYDGEDNLLAETNARGATEHFAYDAQGNLTNLVNRRGREIEFVQNERGQVTRKTFADGSHVDYTYDARGNLKTATDAGGETEFDYTSLDILEKVTYPDGRFLRFEHNIIGQRLKSVDQDGFTVNYAYDDLGRLEALTDGNDALLIRYRYDAAGRIEREEKGNGTATEYEHDEAGQLLKITHLAPDGVTVNSFFEYTYDELGRRDSMTTADGVTRYGYDASGQLTRIESPGGRTIEYQYDAAGNRQRVIDSLLGTTDYVANELNEIIRAGDTFYTYDADGNLVSKRDGAGATAYSYNDENRLDGVTGPGLVAAYGYNPLGHRDRETVNGATTEFLIDPEGLWSITAEYDGGGSTIARYTHGIGLVSRLPAAGEGAYYDFDAMGNTVGMTDENGAYVNLYSYLPFGETTLVAAALPNAFTFAGELGVRQEASGLFDMRFRSYDAATAQFRSVDPLGLAAGDTNLRRYVGNEPTQFADPDGLKKGAKSTKGGAKCPPDPFQKFLKDLKKLGDKLRSQVAKGKYGMRNAMGATLQAAQIYADLAGAAFEAEVDAVVRQFNRFNAYVAGYHGDPLGASSGGGGGGCSCGCPPGTTPGWPGLLGPADPVTPNASFDPNDIVGPGGFGSAGWIMPGGAMPYTIHFENIESATAPAQEVFVTHQLDADLDWSTFELGDFGFGSLEVDVPDGVQSYSTRVEYVNLMNASTPLSIDVTAELDRATGIVRWIFRSVDPLTGELPEGVFDGFLPPNDPSRRGEGFVSYIVRQKSGLPSGTSIDQQASIVFDLNAPIVTNVWTNTMDAEPPTSSVAALPAVGHFRSFPVSWSASDGAGSGAVSYDVFVSIDGGQFILWRDDTTLTSDTYAGSFGHSYAFYSVATDGVGFVEAAPIVADAVTQVVDPATVEFLNGQIVMNGGPDFDVVTFFPGAGAGQVLVRVNATTWGPFQSPSKLVAHGNGGNDRMVVDRTAAMPATPAEFHGGAGRDRLFGGSANDLIFGDAGRDELDGGDGHDRLFGGDDDDVLNGRNGHDVLYGEAGNDRLRGYVGNDMLFGGVGRDYLVGDGGNNVLVGGEGGDRLGAATGRNIMIGSAGRDIVGGGDGGAILISGTTTHDANEVALLAILAEWSSSRTLAERVARLTAGVGAGHYALTFNGTVQNDDSWSVLEGGAGEDWFFKFRKDTLLTANQQIDQITQ